MSVGLGISAVAYESLVADELEEFNLIVVCLATVSGEIFRGQ